MYGNDSDLSSKKNRKQILDNLILQLLKRCLSSDKRKHDHHFASYKQLQTINKRMCSIVEAANNPRREWVWGRGDKEEPKVHKHRLLTLISSSGIRKFCINDCMHCNQTNFIMLKNIYL